MLFQFITAATGMPKLLWLGIMKSMAAKTTKQSAVASGVFLVVSCTRILLPLSLIVGFILILPRDPDRIRRKNEIALPPKDRNRWFRKGTCGCHCAPLQTPLGTNGGGYFAVNPFLIRWKIRLILTNMVECWSYLDYYSDGNGTGIRVLLYS